MDMKEIDRLQDKIKQLNDLLLNERLENIGKVHPCDDQTAANLASALASNEELVRRVKELEAKVERLKKENFKLTEIINPCW